MGAANAAQQCELTTRQGVSKQNPAKFEAESATNETHHSGAPDGP